MGVASRATALTAPRSPACYHLTGWPDRAPVGPNGPYTDVIAPHYAVSALAAAICERRRSGLGQHVDVSQVESAIHFIEPLVLDQTVNGRTAPSAPASIRSTACPHGVYPTAGSRALRRDRGGDAGAVAGAAAPSRRWARSPTRASTTWRRASACGTRSTRRCGSGRAGYQHSELERLLIEAGVPASAVQRMTELQSTTRSCARASYFVTLDHGEMGPMPYDGLVTRFSAKREMLHKAAPCIGEDTERVMREILGLSADQIADYAAAGVFV